MKGYLVRGCELILRVRPVVLGFPHRTGRFRPGGSPFSSPGCRSCRCMEGFLNRRWEPILLGCGEIVGFPRGGTPAACAVPTHWPRASGRGGAVADGIEARKTLGRKLFAYYILQKHKNRRTSSAVFLIGLLQADVSSDMLMHVECATTP